MNNKWYVIVLLALCACAAPAESTETPSIHIEPTNSSESGLFVVPACDLTDEGFEYSSVGTLVAVDSEGNISPHPLTWNTETGTLSNADNSVSIAIEEGETITPEWPEKYAFLTGATLRRCDGDLYIKYAKTH